jgi:hypothetical protein
MNQPLLLDALDASPLVPLAALRRRPESAGRDDPDGSAEVKQGKWVCPCDDMRTYEYCHCLLFTNEQGLPITEHLPENHEGRRTYGLAKDRRPELGRPRRAAAESGEPADAQAILDGTRGDGCLWRFHVD